jgi:hypothetical protein
MAHYSALPWAFRSPQDGHYPVAAYQAAFGFSLALQAAALVWFAIPWLRTFGKHFYFLFAPPPAEREMQANARHNERNEEQNASDRREQQLDVKFRHACFSL